MQPGRDLENPHTPAVTSGGGEAHNSWAVLGFRGPPTTSEVLVDRDVMACCRIELFEPPRQLVGVLEHPLDRARRRNETTEFRLNLRPSLGTVHLGRLAELLDRGPTSACPSTLLVAEQHEALMLGEVDEVTTVHCDEAYRQLDTARSNPRIVLRPRPATKVRTACEPTPRHCDGVVPWHDGLPEYPTINSGPKLRTPTANLGPFRQLADRHERQPHAVAN